ncbi:hypothetical protein JCM1840_004988 [Sporobolomyces johnsonii]
MSTPNYSFYAIPALWLLSGFTHWYAVGLSKASKDLPEFDNVAPRDFYETVRKMDRKIPAVGRFLRAEAATANTLEALPMFTAAIIAGACARLPAEYMNQFAAVYLASRALFSLLYVNTTRRKYSFLRTIVFSGGVASIVRTLLKAGAAFNNRVV